ncbi:uncharacterized protein LOC131864929 [Cryptomeria japonica]|uniref:uncharacterized protein LOC131864929 n=1 Tax=Cryptomeria japonica TaxID=3369 RepID=UPI0027DA0877|nr:uncharacterized protein LOC131864929 [Cryptomeria japonica]
MASGWWPSGGPVVVQWLSGARVASGLSGDFPVAEEEVGSGRAFPVARVSGSGKSGWGSGGGAGPGGEATRRPAVGRSSGDGPESGGATGSEAGEHWAHREAGQGGGWRELTEGSEGQWSAAVEQYGPA